MTDSTLVIVYGASHTLPSAGSKPAVTSFDPDAAHIWDTVTKCVDNGEDVAVVMHSYGGARSCKAVRGLSKEDRAKEGKN